MYAFGLEESGNYPLAEQHGLAALDRNPDDVWATHAVTHVYEMQGRIDEGIRFLRSREADWGYGNLFTVHNWWHLALYLLEAGDADESLAIYDRHIHNEQSAGVPLEMLDASALLWRLHLDGVRCRRSLRPARRCLGNTHVARTVVRVQRPARGDGAGRRRPTRRGRERSSIGCRPTSQSSPPSSNVGMTADVGLPACRSVLAYIEDRHVDVVAELMPIRTILARFGGSHAQRDALQRTLVDSAIRSGQLQLARSLVDERLGVRETSVWSWRRRTEVLTAAGDVGAADWSEQRAAAHAARFAAAASVSSARSVPG